MSKTTSQAGGDDGIESQELPKSVSPEATISEPPDGGLAAWITVFGSFLLVLNTWYVFEKTMFG